MSTDIRLADVFGDCAVGIDPDGELWLVNVRTGDSHQLTDDGSTKHDATLSADYVTYIDQPRMIQLPGQPVPVYSSDVFARNRHTSEERRVTNMPAGRYGLRISGPRPVWHNNRNGLLVNRRRNYDIYVNDLGRDLEIPVAAVFRPEIDVRHTRRHGGVVGQPGRSGSGNVQSGLHQLFRQSFRRLLV